MNVDLIELRDQVTEILTTYGLEVLGAIAILVVGWILAGWARAGTRRALNRVRWMDDTVRPIFAAVVGYLVLAITLIAVLNQFGVQTASIIAVLGAAGLAVGLALQGTLSNVAAGVMLLFLRPFKVGDYVDAGGASGTVKEVGLFNTELATPDNVYIVVPNSAIFSQDISNYSRYATRRLDIPVGVAYDVDLTKAMAVLTATLEADGRALADPAPQVMVMELGDSAITLNLRFWVNAADLWPCKWAMNKAVKEALDAAGIEIPFPQRVLHMKTDTPPA
ncbi:MULTISPECIES: mechanosensitive ion channel family protein [Thalassobaculum]|uniref:Small-conductance mechanosensitive channel n=1 Tax=Thalassobaculum litoreum DSM 18839 TaxID=1123362 RepID=A0A8G2EWD6_9PROT|nr:MULTISPECIES: mechanosensitive ion channel domain-containing protein [Thalassobaculum]SDF76121.1 small conductance mechanosensitive channel [Thalassobaculum litoreum DSM 18839]